MIETVSKVSDVAHKPLVVFNVFVLFCFFVLFFFCSIYLIFFGGDGYTGYHSTLSRLPRVGKGVGHGILFLPQF